MSALIPPTSSFSQSSASSGIGVALKQCFGYFVKSTAATKNLIQTTSRPKDTAINKRATRRLQPHEQATLRSLQQNLQSEQKTNNNRFNELIGQIDTAKNNQVLAAIKKQVEHSAQFGVHYSNTQKAKLLKAIVSKQLALLPDPPTEKPSAYSSVTKRYDYNTAQNMSARQLKQLAKVAGRHDALQFYLDLSSDAFKGTLSINERNEMRAKLLPKIETGMQADKRQYAIIKNKLLSATSQQQLIGTKQAIDGLKLLSGEQRQELGSLLNIATRNSPNTPRTGGG